jgi:hypothetical protein
MRASVPLAKFPNILPALDNAGSIGPPLNISYIPLSAHLASAVNCSPIYAADFRDETPAKPYGHFAELQLLASNDALYRQRPENRLPVHKEKRPIYGIWKIIFMGEADPRFQNFYIGIISIKGGRSYTLFAESMLVLIPIMEFPMMSIPTGKGLI